MIPIDEKTEKYILKHSESESDILRNIFRTTHLTTVYPQMLSGNLQGKFLGFLARLSKAETILEIGSFTGYSAIAMAEMTADNVMIHTIEVNEEFEKTITQNIESAGFSHRIKLHIGEASAIIPKLDIEPDFVFIDADKKGYLDYYKLTINKIKQGGIIVADNVLWGGKVINADEKCDDETLAIKEFNDFVQNDKRVMNIILPLRDGLMLITKI